MVFLIMGVSGSGKSTVGAALADAIGASFVDADDFHSRENVAKMRRGEPLTESEREPWLHELRSMIDGWLNEGRTAVLACSALTRRSRRILGAERADVRVVFLCGPKDLLAARMRGRGHFMPPSLLDSQIATLERPEGALELDIRAAPAELVGKIVASAGLVGSARSV
jgi:gluconokinase